jgi:hypothetical protein
MRAATGRHSSRLSCKPTLGDGGVIVRAEGVAEVEAHSLGALQVALRGALPRIDDHGVQRLRIRHQVRELRLMETEVISGLSVPKKLVVQ